MGSAEYGPKLEYLDRLDFLTDEDKLDLSSLPDLDYFLHPVLNDYKISEENMREYNFLEALVNNYKKSATDLKSDSCDPISDSLCVDNVITGFLNNLDKYSSSVGIFIPYNMSHPVESLTKIMDTYEYSLDDYMHRQELNVDIIYLFTCSEDDGLKIIYKNISDKHNLEFDEKLLTAALKGKMHNVH